MTEEDLLAIEGLFQYYKPVDGSHLSLYGGLGCFVAAEHLPALVAEVRKLKSSVMSCEELEEKLKKAQDDAENAWITVDGLVAFNAELREENERLKKELGRVSSM